MIFPIGCIVGNDSPKARRFNPGLGNIFGRGRLLKQAGKKNDTYRQNRIQPPRGLSSER